MVCKHKQHLFSNPLLCEISFSYIHRACMYNNHVSHWVYCLCEAFWTVHFFTVVGYCCYCSTMETFKISNEYSGNDSEITVSSVEVKTQTNTVCLASYKSIRSKILLVLMIFIVVVMLQFPTILYYTKIPSPGVSLLDSVNLETCSVSCRIQLSFCTFQQYLQLLQQ